jgi:RND family efflux transporter MFP subunit
VVSKTLRVSAPDAGLISVLPVELNQAVKKGQLLFQLDDQEARQQLRSAEAELNSARTKADENLALLGIRQQQSILQLQQSLSSQQEAALTLQESRSGATLEERQKLRESVRQAQLKAATSEQDLVRQRQLFQEEIVSQAALDTAESQYRLDQSSYREAMADLRAQSKGARPEELARLQAKQQYARLGADLARQKSQEESLLSHRLRASLAEVERLQAAVARQRYLVERRRVASPSDGVVSQLNYHAGEMVGGYSIVLSVVTNGPYWVEAEVDEQDAVHVAVGQPVRVMLTSLPGKTIAGKVAQVAPSLEARPQGPSDHKVLRIRVDLTEKVAELRAGLEADVEGQVGLAKEALSVPRAALLRDQGKDYVYTVNGGKLSRVEVQLGAVSGDRAEIRSGLSDGAEVVVEGGDGLAAGTPVRVRP